MSRDPIAEGTIPEIDERSFEQLVASALAVAQARSPHWTLDVNDPGRALIEAFAFLSRTISARLNRSPARTRALLIRLLGVAPRPPAAAEARIVIRRAAESGDRDARGRARSRRRNAREDAAELRDIRAEIAEIERALAEDDLEDEARAALARDRDAYRAEEAAVAADTAAAGAPGERPAARSRIVIPRGARISTSTDVTFVTLDKATLEPDEDQTSVRALHANLLEGALVGTADGAYGGAFRLPRFPVIAHTGDGLDIFLGISMAVDEAGASAPVQRSVETREHAGRRYEIWRECESFAPTGDAEARRFLCARAEGIVYFPPEGLGARPPAGAEIRVWCRTGGGAEGNVPPGSATRLDIAGLAIEGFSTRDEIEVFNPERAAGGEDAETPDDMLRRAFYEVRGGFESLVTAADFENFALEGLNRFSRASAQALAERWRHARPGIVHMLVAPSRIAGLRQAEIEARQTPEELQRLADAATPRLPIGVGFRAAWYRYRPISVRATISAYREVQAEALGARITARLIDLLSPDDPAWRVTPCVVRHAMIHEAIADEAGVRHVNALTLSADRPTLTGAVGVAADRFQPGAWYVAAGDGVHRSLDDATSWVHVLGASAGADLVAPHPRRPGCVAAISGEERRTRHLSISPDCGETWRAPLSEALPGRPHDLAWSAAAAGDLLYIAMQTEDGVASCVDIARGNLRPVDIGDLSEIEDCRTLETTEGPFGEEVLALAIRPRRANTAHAFSTLRLRRGSGSFEALPPIERSGAYVKCLHFSRRGDALWLWAGLEAFGDSPGLGVARIELSASDPAWELLSAGWSDGPAAGGTCETIAIADDIVLVGSNRRGIMQLDESATEPVWRDGGLENGLPLAARGRCEPVRGLGTVAEDARRVIIAATARGVYRAGQLTGPFVNMGAAEADNTIILPRDHLPCPGDIEIAVADDPAWVGGADA